MNYVYLKELYLNYYGRYVQHLEYLKYLQTEDEKEKQRRRLLAKQDSLPSLDLDYEGILGILQKTEGYKEFCGHRLSLNFQHTTETKFEKLIRFLEDEISIYNSEFLYDSQEIHESLEVEDIDQKSALSFVDNISINDEDDQNTDQLIFDHSSYELEGIQKIILSQKIEETMHFTMVNSILHDNNNQDQEQEDDHLNQQGSQSTHFEGSIQYKS